MKFKIGQKVRVKEWVGMPRELFADWGINAQAGCTGIITKEKGRKHDYDAYDVKVENNKYDSFFFEGELESIIKVGEQLTFSFMEE